MFEKEEKKRVKNTIENRARRRNGMERIAVNELRK